MPKSKKSKEEAAAEKFGPKLPDAVAKQGEDADKMLAGEDPTKPTNPEPVEPEVNNPEPPKPTNPEPDDFVPPEPEPAKPDDWEQKYKVLKGKYDAEIGDLRTGVQNLNTIIQQQNTMIENLQAGQVAQPAQSAPAAGQAQQAVEGMKKLDPDDFASYGDEIMWLVKGFNQLIDQVGQPRAAESTAGGERFERVERMVQETATDRYLGHLDAAIPNWRSINDSAEFKAWLGTSDPVTGYRYNDVLRFAANELRHGQVIAMFQRYAAEKGADLGSPGQPAPAPANTGIVRDNGVVDETVDPLASQVAMDTSAATGDNFVENPPVPPGQKAGVPTAQDVARASALYAKGKISMEKFNEISNRFQQAQNAAK